MGEFPSGLDCGIFVGKFGKWDGFWEERYGVDDVFGVSAWYPDAIALVMVEGWAKVPAIRAMWGPSLAIGGFFVDGARGLRVKSKLPLSWAYAESLGLRREARRRLRVSSAWGRRRHQFDRGKLGSVLARPAMKWFLKVRMARLEAFRRWICWGYQLVFHVV